MNILKKAGQIIIVGGGIAGLYTARELLLRGCIVTILEATDRLGGRIHTIRNSSFIRPVEKGVEFIHGNLPLTIQLLNEAHIKFVPVGGMMNRVVDGDWKTQDDFALGWNEVMRRMNEVRDDMTLNEFLERNFSDAKHEAVRNSVLRFAEGFDLADPSEASVLALREEWMGEEDEQYRIPGGFDQLTDYLEKKCTQLGCIIHRSTRAHKIVWSKDEVTITSDKGIYYGNQVVITVPLPLLQQQQIIFEPAIPDHIDAAKRIGFGTVVKVVLEFKESFWREKKKNIGFILSNEIIPTWWTQSPSSYPLLTGWAGGPQAWPMKDSNDEVILDLALYSLSNIFNRPVADLQKIMNTFLIANWHTEPFTMGAYSYSLVGSTPAQLLFNDPIADTIFFAGEAFYNGCSPGTVEAALESAKNVVETMAERGEQ